MKHSSLIARAALLLALGAPVATLPACSDDEGPPPGSASAPVENVDSAAADLRTNLNLKLGEHQILAAKATGAALGGREAEFQAYGALLNENGAEIGAMVGAAYGDSAKNEFNRIWSAHNGFFVDYTVGVATEDKAKQDKAVADLTGTYVPEFSKLLAGATGLPEDAVAGLTTEHVVMTKGVVDAQAAGNAADAAKRDRESAEHMQMIGDALAPAIVGKLPEKF